MFHSFMLLFNRYIFSRNFFFYLLFSKMGLTSCPGWPKTPELKGFSCLSPTDLSLQAPNTSPGLQELLKDSLLWKILNIGKWREKNNEPIYSYLRFMTNLMLSICPLPPYIYPVNFRHLFMYKYLRKHLQILNSTYVYMHTKIFHYYALKFDSCSLLVVYFQNWTFLVVTNLF